MKAEDPKIRGFEVVMVKNEHIDLFASLVSLDNGKAVVEGRVILGEEKKLQSLNVTFRSDSVESSTRRLNGR